MGSGAGDLAAPTTRRGRSSWRTICAAPRGPPGTKEDPIYQSMFDWPLACPVLHIYPGVSEYHPNAYFLPRRAHEAIFLLRAATGGEEKYQFLTG